MIKKLLVTVLLAMTLALSACGVDDSEDLKDGGVTEATTEEKETEKETEDDSKKESKKKAKKQSKDETEAPTTEASTEAPTKANNTSDPILGSAITSDGFISYSRADIQEIIESSGMVEKSVSVQEVESGSTENGKQKIYRFAMQNMESVQEIDGNSGEKLYITSLLLNGETYYVSFGTNEEHEYDEILPYCSEGKQVEYWAFASGQDGMVLLIPFIAGSEDNGYYLVLPCIEQMGGDVSGFEIPDEPLGDDIGSTTNTGTKNTDTTEPETVMSNDMLEKVVLDVTGVKNDPIITVVDCNVTNGLDFAIALSGDQLLINGVDCTDKFTSFFIVEGNDVIEDAFYLDGIQLKAGDKLQFVYGLSNNDTFEDLGQIYFEMVLQ